MERAQNPVLETSAILETCRAKVKGKSVKASSELTEVQMLTASATFAPLPEK
jgi:hypothetical protein